MINRLDCLLEEVRANGNSEESEKMSAYMKDNFVFMGVPRPVLKKIIKPYLNEGRKMEIDWKVIFSLWDTDFREAQYIAIEYMMIHRKQIKPEDIDKLKQLITTKSWWETVDSLDGFVGELALNSLPVKEIVNKWAVSDNVWLKRVSINYQLSYKELTDTDSLRDAILQNLGSNEFFINKAIGWSLREYSKTNPEWVRSFLDTYGNSMAKLSIREASKYLSNE